MGGAAGHQPHAFISYVREDAAAARRLRNALTDVGIPTWIDTDDLWPGEDWPSKIRDAITNNALVFIACFSDAALTRAETYQRKELDAAIEQMKLRRPDTPWLIPIRFSRCTIPSYEIGLGRRLDTLQWVDLFDDTWEQGITRLIAGIKRIMATLDLELPIRSSAPVSVDPPERRTAPDNLAPDRSQSGPRSTAMAKRSGAHPFLSDAWLDAFESLRYEAPEPSASMTDLTLNIVVIGGPDGDKEVHLSGGQFGSGRLDTQTTLTVPYEVAKARFVDGDQRVWLEAFMGGRIKVNGDMRLFMKMQAELGIIAVEHKAFQEKIRAITD